MVKPPSLTGLMPKLATQGCRQRGSERERGREGGGRGVELYPRGAAVARSRARYAYVMLYAFKLYKSRSVRDECAHESAHTHTHSHTHTPAHTHSTRHTYRYTFYFIIPALSFILLYFTLLLVVVVFFGFISTYFTLHFFHAAAVIVVCIFRIWLPPAQNKWQLLRRISESLCVNPSH